MREDDRSDRRPNMKICLALVCIVCAMLARPSASIAQADVSPMRMLTVDGVPMRVWAAGLEQRKPGQPVTVLEAGAGADLETWKPIFSEVSHIGPVVAYDRRALGQSGADTAAPTFTRTAQTLHAVLQALKAPPPYVLVGHSMGGVFIRGFASMYPGETVGMVYLDVPDFESTREERAAVLPAEDRKAALAPPVLPEIPPGTPPGLAAVYQQQLNEMRDDYPSARSWKQPPGISVAVVITTRTDRMGGNGGAMVRLQMKHQSEWVLGSPNSLFVLAGHTGHQVHRDDPQFVVQLIRHVYERSVPK
jgi:pimeloyl-ACP methyl ester carboxylesterase